MNFTNNPFEKMMKEKPRLRENRPGARPAVAVPTGGALDAWPATKSF